MTTVLYFPSVFTGQSPLAVTSNPFLWSFSEIIGYQQLSDGRRSICALPGYLYYLVLLPNYSIGVLYFGLLYTEARNDTTGYSRNKIRKTSYPAEGESALVRQKYQLQNEYCRLFQESNYLTLATEKRRRQNEELADGFEQHCQELEFELQRLKRYYRDRSSECAGLRRYNELDRQAAEREGQMHQLANQTQYLRAEITRLRGAQCYAQRAGNSGERQCLLYSEQRYQGEVAKLEQFLQGVQQEIYQCKDKEAEMRISIQSMAYENMILDDLLKKQNECLRQQTSQLDYFANSNFKYKTLVLSSIVKLKYQQIRALEYDYILYLLSGNSAKVNFAANHAEPAAGQPVATPREARRISSEVDAASMRLQYLVYEYYAENTRYYLFTELDAMLLGANEPASGNASQASQFRDYVLSITQYLADLMSYYAQTIYGKKDIDDEVIDAEILELKKELDGIIGDNTALTRRIYLQYYCQ